ncbi:PIN domain-containing protein [Mesorhizobium sp. M0998]|uniref:PIN domain-containing protein n=1 Tax=Mesorhizobium sp. M0998 TaxID=2957044 RepID=UPI00333AD4DD
MRLLLDTATLVAAIRSDAGASRQLLVAALERRLTLIVSVTLMIEYQAVMTRPKHLEASALSLPLRSRAGPVEDRRIPETRMGSFMSDRRNAPTRRTKRLRSRLSLPKGLSLPLPLQARSIFPRRHHG